MSGTKLRDAFSFLRPDQIVDIKPDLIEISRSTLPDQRTPDLVLYPENAEQVQQIVREAQRQSQSLWYVSTGKNWGYGCKSAPYEGQITVVLERMKKIHHVDEKLGYAVIEPGVTYAELNQHLKKKGIKLWTDSAGTTKSASVIGNALDKGRGLTPYADHFSSLCGMHVVLPDGELLDTAPTPQYHSRHTYKWSLGPFVEGIFAQSNFGIVVRAGIWLMPIPERFEFFAFEYTASERQFSRFIDDFRELVFSQGLLSRPHLANDFAMLCIVDRYPYDLLAPGEKRLSSDALAAWKKKHGIKAWTFGGGLYGTGKQIAAQKSLIKKHLGEYGSLRFIGAADDGSLYSRLYRKAVMLGARLDGKSDEFIRQIFPAMELFCGTPTDEFAKQVYFKSNGPRPTSDFNPAADGCGFIWTGPLVPFTSEHVQRALVLSSEVFAKYEFEIFTELIIESPRTLIMLFGVFFDPNNQEESGRARAWYKEMRARMVESGYSPYRETTSSMHQAMEHNPTLQRLLSSVRSAIDVHHILAPGRYGID